MRDKSLLAAKIAGGSGGYLFTIVNAMIVIMSFATKNYYFLSIGLPVVTMIMILDRLGKGIVLRELIALYSQFVCLVMPAIGYMVYSKQNHLATVWNRFMQVPEDRYFDFALPAEALFTLAICWPIKTRISNDVGPLLFSNLERIKQTLTRMPKTGLTMVIVGLTSWLIASFLPSAAQFIGTLVFWSAFAGVLYIYFTPGIKRKSLYLIGFAVVIFITALQNGMFTLVAYMGITIFSFFFIGKRIALWKKVSIFVVGCAFLLVLQSTKGAYRKYIWHQGFEDNKAALFGNLFVEKLGDFSGFFSADAFFPFYYRMNQGYNISLVMKRFPEKQEFDYGDNVGLSIISSLVPRLFWPDKPEAGGKFNMKYYTGIQLQEGWSTNVGPLGEAYGSFGGLGILFMLFIGCFIRWVYKRVFVLAETTPLLILWIPVIFYQVTYSAESDTLQIFNSVIKSCFFVWLLFKITPSWFGKPKKSGRPGFGAKHLVSAQGQIPDHR